jgi:DNA-directed RNA polymerase specialized sigma24 family protein
MTGHSDDELEGLLAAWRTREEATELFRELRDPMRRAARRGIRRVLGNTPDPADVNDVLLKAFKEVLGADPATIERSLLGFACTVAYRRGMDKARAIIREREKINAQAWQIEQLRIDAADEVAAAHRERLLRYAEDCMSTLTPEQRDVLEATVQRQESLSNWAATRGTTYEAGRRMRLRALAALARCVKGKAAVKRPEEF